MTGLNLWILNLQKKRTFGFISKNSCIRILFENTIFRNHHSWWNYFRNHTQTSVCEIFCSKALYFRKYLFRDYFLWILFRKHPFKYDCENKFIENSFRNHENFRNLTWWKISKILHISMFSINSLSKTHLVIFFEISLHTSLRKQFFLSFSKSHLMVYMFAIIVTM